jgi:DNA-binding transcriptional ArsR family regulator
MNSKPPVPLDHRVRRQILRRLHEVGGNMTAVELSAYLKLELPEILYHARILAKYKAVEESQGVGAPATKHFRSTVAADPDVITLLASTKAEDEPE